MNKKELETLIENKVRSILKESDYSFQNIRISVYDDELTISSKSGKNMDLKVNQIPELIKLLQKIYNKK
jgi:hypothetical protein